MEVVIDEEGLLTASEPKKARTDDVIGDFITGARNAM